MSASRYKYVARQGDLWRGQRGGTNATGKQIKYTTSQTYATEIEAAHNVDRCVGLLLLPR